MTPIKPFPVLLQPATPTDLPILAELNRLAYLPETTAMIAFKHWPDPVNMLAFFTSRIQQRFDNADTQVIKAVDASTGEIAGFVCWTLESGEEEVPGFKENFEVGGKIGEKEGGGKLDPTAAAMEQMPGLDFFNMPFLMYMAKKVEVLKNHMKGEKHYYVSTFVVNPSLWRQGIGSQILSHCLAMADEASLPTWLSAFPGSHSLYLRMGFEDVDFVDVDLNEWDGGRRRGFGVYRNYAMVRRVSAKQGGEK